MRSLRRLMLGLYGALAVLVGSPNAFAQAASARDEAPVYEFVDDYMVGSTLDGTPPLLRVPGQIRPRILLIRPRASFVAELLTSVEHL